MQHVECQASQLQSDRSETTPGNQPFILIVSLHRPNPRNLRDPSLVLTYAGVGWINFLDASSTHAAYCTWYSYHTTNDDNLIGTHQALGSAARALNQHYPESFSLPYNIDVLLKGNRSDDNKRKDYTSDGESKVVLVPGTGYRYQTRSSLFSCLLRSRSESTDYDTDRFFVALL
jgi:hypothetical protein